jgi:hypothetical protein
MAKPFILVSNKSRTMPATLKAADKETITIMAKAVKIPVDPKFGWNPPRSVIIYDPSKDVKPEQTPPVIEKTVPANQVAAGTVLPGGPGGGPINNSNNEQPAKTTVLVKEHEESKEHKEAIPSVPTATKPLIIPQAKQPAVPGAIAKS